MPKCRDCKKTFDCIDANQRCIQCWYEFNCRIRMSKLRYILFSIECGFFDIIHSISNPFKTKVCYCVCESDEIQNYTGVKQ